MSIESIARRGASNALVASARKTLHQAVGRVGMSEPTEGQLEAAARDARSAADCLIRAAQELRAAKKSAGFS